MASQQNDPVVSGGNTAKPLEAELGHFAAVMSRRLAEKQKKFGDAWRETNPALLLNGLVKALVEAQGEPQNPSKWADVANYAMFIAVSPPDQRQRLALGAKLVPLPVRVIEAQSLNKSKLSKDEGLARDAFIDRLAKVLAPIAALPAETSGSPEKGDPGAGNGPQTGEKGSGGPPAPSSGGGSPGGALTPNMGQGPGRHGQQVRK